MKQNITNQGKTLLLLLVSILFFQTISARVNSTSSTTPSTEELSHYIQLTVTPGRSYTFYLYVFDHANNPVWIKNGSSSYQKYTVSNDWDNYTVTNAARTITICGNELKSYSCTVGTNAVLEMQVINQDELTNNNFTGSSISTLIYQNNALGALYFSGLSGLQKLVVSHSPNLKILHAQDMANLTTLEVIDNDSLLDLDCSRNSLTSLVVNQVPNLTQLYCNSNAFTELTITDLPKLNHFQCSNSKQLQKLDVHNNPQLSIISFDNSAFTSLDVSYTAIPNLWLSGHKPALTDLNVTGNVALQQLHCANNDLTSLDLSTNTALTTLYAYDNALTYLNVANGNNAYISNFQVQNNALTCIQVDDGFTPIVNSAVTTYWEKDAEADYNNNAADPCPGVIDHSADEAYILLTVMPGETISFYAKGEGCTSDLSVSNMSALDQSVATSDPVQHFNLTPTRTKFTFTPTTVTTTIKIQGAVTYFNCSNNLENIMGLDVSNNPYLTHLYCNNNAISTLTLATTSTSTSSSESYHLQVLSCDFNALTSLEVSALPDLSHLSCQGNLLTELSLSSNTALTDLSCGINKLTTLEVSENVNLTQFSCSFNRLATLDLSANTKLVRVQCAHNQLEKLKMNNGTESSLTKWYDLPALDATNNARTLEITVDQDFSAPVTGDQAWNFDPWATFTEI